MLGLLLDTEDVRSEFLQDILALQELLFLLHLRLHHVFVHLVLRRGYVLANLGILENQRFLRASSARLACVSLTPILGWFY